ncbi:hypothetical protein OS493_038574 [Desmophyllum pertusum]|uniref:TauD/TfdA-like domain-containing protein n=1 Tax=Desmophyllum pertusum TaxID=174260 RepID=A0A9W9ZVK1_9CNID|nr:hypothetical protein OS493_038574 [Desmophyllum pertusum]
MMGTRPNSIRVGCGFVASVKQCKQSHSGQRTIDVASIPDPLELSDFTVSKNKEDLHLRWELEDDHQGVINLQWLRDNCYSEAARQSDSQKRVTQPHLGEVGRRIGPVQETIYGETFNVMSVPNPINIAYSTAGLDYHMDLMYYESAPGLQLLHCLRFDPEVEGGESTFVDSFHVAEEFRKQFPDDFENLVRISGTFQKIHFERDYPVKLVYKRPHIVLNPEKEIVAVNWSPPFEGPPLVPEEDVEPYFKAYRIFSKLLRESPIQKSVRIQPGDLACFNNRRILHGRKSFNLNGGVRFLKGAYVNIDEFRNTFQVTSELTGSGEPCKRIGNHCFF